MILFPNAKINLGLQVTQKRKDGYHDIRTCMVPVPLCDALEMITANKTGFHSTGLPIPGAEKDNLILKAFQLLRKDFNSLPHLDIHLHKAIPMGAGLGGGSADAAFALKLMNELFDLFLEDWVLEDYAAQLGSDCPFFIDNSPQIATGRGEILEKIDVPLQNKWLLLVTPPLHVGTKEAYAGVVPKPPEFDLKTILVDPSTWKDQLTNDFEVSVFQQYPEIAAIKKRMYSLGAFYASMSGSGATVFGLFDEEPPVEKWPENYFTFKSQL